ncbi:phosphate ABC transporter substrate-binding protein PstS [Allostreptomyces psammosilenae]|uniref:Phosphate-binding protein n=1 Tax=Allostreptomyces psammosilenae TaxID=1892865 RepID=A0A852ZZD4_9ACTN|nr:phosphate ABC transporter substrate-binding protein PstS [Allostreptomyces psammosilenae]NYI07509.1 phosphate transport system substrate-binding protein [Allostreptomyces psammosilenae]
MKLNRNGRLKGLAIGTAAVVSSLTLVACGSDDNTGGDSGGSDTSATTGAVACPESPTELMASGSSAQKNAMDEWVKAYQAACEGASVNYQSVGSSSGRTQFLEGTTDFAGSDSAIKEDELTQSEQRCEGGRALNLPMLAGPIAIAYNLEGVEDLVLDAPTIAGIFDGSITKWNAPEIAALNEGVELPDTDIQAYHRSDGSGTTDNFTKFLEAAAPDAWTYGTGSDWSGPADATGAQSAKGSEGVTKGVEETPGAITYVEVSFAENSGLSTARIATGAAEPVAVTPEAVSTTIAGSEITGTDGDLTMSLNYATTEDGAYPIALITYEIVCSTGNDAEKLDDLKAFLNYTASEAGQGLLPDNGYAALPTEVAEQVRTTIDSLS